MDIQELKQFESVYQPSKEIAFCWGVKKYVQLSVEENHTEIVDHANDSLRIWQAAKAQEIPEGFIVVPITPSDDFIDKLADVICDEFDTTIIGSAHCATQAYKLIVEAHEQAND